MNCSECKERLIAYIEGLLTESQEQAIASHLQGCPPCRAEATELISLRDRLVANGEALAKSDLENKVLNRIVREQNLKLRKISKLGNQIQLWRIIMKSRITKIAAAAAVIIVAVMIGINHFGGSIDMTSVAFAQATEALKKVSWVHTTGTGGEDWVNRDSQVCITKNPDGVVRFIDYRKGKKYEYDPEANVVTISWTLQGFSELPLRWEQYLKLFAERKPDAEISHRQDQVEGKKVWTYKVIWARKGFRNESEVTVDAKTDLPLFAQLKTTSLDGTVVMETKTVFEYPQEGPATIYDVGVPRSAEIFDYSENLAKAREESAKKLKRLGLALFMYASQHEEKYPDTLQELQRRVDDLKWFLENVEYLGKGKTTTDVPPTPVAYDKTLLEKGTSTNILFNDGHVLFEVSKLFKK